MTIRRRLQLVYLLILLSTVGIGALAVWPVARWHCASIDLTHSHLQGERMERARGDIYRQVKEMVDWLTRQDKDADEEFRHLAEAIDGEVAAYETVAKREAERMAIQVPPRSYRGLVSLAETVLNDPRTNQPEMPWIEEKIESQPFP